MAEYDLTAKVGQYLDRHLVFPLIEFLSGKEVFDRLFIFQMFTKLFCLKMRKNDE